jgi:hypothetical protein
MMMDDETLLRDRKELTQLLADQRLRRERVIERSNVCGVWRQWLIDDIESCIAGLEEDIALIDEEMAQ